jgi:hypothetical protein
VRRRGPAPEARLAAGRHPQLGEAFTFLQRLYPADLVGAFAQQIGGPLQDRGPARRRGVTPFGEGGGGSVKGSVQIGIVGYRKLGQNLFGSRIDQRECVVPRTTAPLPGNLKLKFGKVHRLSAFRRFISRTSRPARAARWSEVKSRGVVFRGKRVIL